MFMETQVEEKQTRLINAGVNHFMELFVWPFCYHCVTRFWFYLCIPLQFNDSGPIL